MPYKHNSKARKKERSSQDQAGAHSGKNLNQTKSRRNDEKDQPITEVLRE